MLSRAAEIGETKLIAPLIGLLGELQAKDVDLRWGYSDDQEDGAVSQFATIPAEFPAVWAEIEPVNSSCYDWAANILQVIVEGEVFVTLNQQPGDVIFGAENHEPFSEVFSTSK